MSRVSHRVLLEACRALSLTFLLASVATPLVSQSSTVAEYRSKANFLATFPRFVDWPESAFSSPQAPLLICVRGDFSFGTLLAEVARASSSHGRRIDVRWVHSDQELRGCHIAFVTCSCRKRPRAVVRLARDFQGRVPRLLQSFDGDELKARLRTGERILHLEDRLVEAREEMRFKATHDHLTSLWNRGVNMDLLSRELARSQRENLCTALLLGDLDHFKSVNDTHGHLVGDQVLREVARRLLLAVRSYDFVGRYGGEEFLIVLLPA